MASRTVLPSRLHLSLTYDSFIIIIDDFYLISISHFPTSDEIVQSIECLLLRQFWILNHYVVLWLGARLVIASECLSVDKTRLWRVLVAVVAVAVPSSSSKLGPRLGVLPLLSFLMQGSDRHCDAHCRVDAVLQGGLLTLRNTRISLSMAG